MSSYICKISVEAKDDNGLIGYDSSSFTVSVESDVIPPTITVNYPNGGEILSSEVSYEITWEATGEQHRALDLSPNYRQGVIRIPYSLNKAIVWPLSESDRNKLSSRSFSKLEEVERMLHPDQWKERFGGRSYIRGRAKLAFKRLLDVFTR